MKNKFFLCIIFVMTVGIILVACDNSSTEVKNETEVVENDNDSSETENINQSDTTGEGKVIKVGTNTTIKDTVEAVEPIFEENTGYEMEIVVFEDSVQPNVALAEGSLDANCYQHLPYLMAYNESNETNLVAVGGEDPGIWALEFGIYSTKYDSIEDIPEGARIGLVSDTTNQSIGLKLLQEQGLIKLDPEVEFPKTVDVIENPKNLELLEMGNARQLMSSMEDLDAGCPMGQEVAVAGKDPNQAIAYASSDLISELVNIVAVQDGNEEEDWALGLYEGLRSPEMEEFYRDFYKGSVRPMSEL